jgi:hypothetical protein
MTSASLLIVLMIGTVVGALTGLAVGGWLGLLWTAILAGFLGTIIGAVVRNYIIARGAGMGPDDSHTPVPVIVYAAIASLAASSGALEIAQQSALPDTPVWVGALAGLFAAILNGMLMIVYHTKPGEKPALRSRRR